jgi:hypothetical protein
LKILKMMVVTMMIEHRNLIHDYANRCYHCSFCKRRWDDDDADPGCVTGHEKVIMMLEQTKAKINERPTKPGNNR